MAKNKRPKKVPFFKVMKRQSGTPTPRDTNHYDHEMTFVCPQNRHTISLPVCLHRQQTGPLWYRKSHSSCKSCAHYLKIARKRCTFCEKERRRQVAEGVAE